MAVKYWNKKVVLFKIEATYGTDPNPTGAANALLVQNLSVSPMEGQDIARDLDRPLFAADSTLAANLHAKLTFKVELASSGAAGSAPAWGPLIRACGCAQTIAANTSVTYNPVSDGIESGTFHFHYDGIRHRLRGARGTFKMMVEASNIPYLEFEFTGLFEPATDTANPAAVLSAFKAPVVATAASTPVFTIDGTSMVLRRLSFDAGAAVEPRFLIGAAGESILITGRSETLEAQIEAGAMSTFNPYQKAMQNAQMPVVLQHGTAAGARITLNVPKAQMQRPSGIDAQQNVAEWPLRFIPQLGTGNDQWTLVLT